MSHTLWYSIKREQEMLLPGLFISYPSTLKGQSSFLLTVSLMGNNSLFLMQPPIEQNIKSLHMCFIKTRIKHKYYYLYGHKHSDRV